MPSAAVMSQFALRNPSKVSDCLRKALGFDDLEALRLKRSGDAESGVDAASRNFALPPPEDWPKAGDTRGGNVA